MKIPRIVLAGTSSGVGKTSITCGLIYALKKKGYSVQPFKVGPDYIDPVYLTSVSDNKSYNLDAWIMGRNQLLHSFLNHSKSDISVIEGVMGYYDGLSGNSDFASTYHVAELTKSPVILILDASKTARSIAATALGFQKFQKNSRISGIILNKISSPKHEALCRQALQKVKIPIIGIIPKNSEIILESRHLGLLSTINQDNLHKKIKKVSKIISSHLDIEEIIKLIKNPILIKNSSNQINKKPVTTIAVALDDSFNFYYNDNLESLRRNGAALKFFSPIKDKKLPACDGIYIGGGFPEILGDSLEKNTSMKQSIKKLSEQEIPIYAECGGLMYLTKSIDYGERKYKMVGLYDAETKMTKKMKLNYTKGKIFSQNVISERSHLLRGHEFHYSELSSVSSDSKFGIELDTGFGIKNNKDGLILYNTLASYGHLYFDSSNYAKIFVKNCIKYSKR